MHFLLTAHVPPSKDQRIRTDIGGGPMKRRDFLKLSSAAALASAYPGTSLLADEIGVDAAARTITIGGFTPVTGPVPFYAILTHAADAYFKSVNEAGGIKGWKINYVTLDDGYDPARSVAAVRRL